MQHRAIMLGVILRALIPLLTSQLRIARRSAATSSPTTRRSPSGRRRRVERDACRRCSAPPAAACRSGCTCTSRSAASAATSATSASTPTRTRSEVEDYLDVAGARVGAVQRSSRRSPAGRSNFVYFGGGTPSFLSTRQLDGARRAADGGHAVDVGRGDHVRVRARHADRSQARGDPRHGRHAAQPRRRELRRSHPRAERPRAPLAGDRPRLRVRAVARLSADQHRPDRRHARRDRGELAALRRARRSSSSRTASPSTRWSCRSTRRSAATCCKGTRPFQDTVADWATKRRWVDEAFEALERAGYTSAAPTRR